MRWHGMTLFAAAAVLVGGLLATPASCRSGDATTTERQHDNGPLSGQARAADVVIDASREPVAGTGCAEADRAVLRKGARAAVTVTSKA